jgi:hypothetical protein
MDFSKKSYEAKIAELNAELNKQEKQVELSENKLQSIAHGGAIFGMDGARSDSSAMITLRFSKITVSEEALKLMESARPLLFVAVEFFDFELMTTPQLQGPEYIS